MLSAKNKIYQYNVHVFTIMYMLFYSSQFEICEKKIKPFLISTCYRPPNSPIDLLNKFECILRLIDIQEKEYYLRSFELQLEIKVFNQKYITNLYQYDQLIDEPTRNFLSKVINGPFLYK